MSTSKNSKIHHESKHEHEQLVAILCYFFVGVIWYFLDKEMNKSRLVNFHSKQMINYCIFSVVVTAFGQLIPFIGVYVASLASLVLLVFWIIGLIGAVNMELKPMPLIGDFAENYLKY